MPVYDAGVTTRKTIMKYMLLLYADTRAGARIPPEDMARWMEKMHAYRDTLTKAGAFVATAGLKPFWEATTVNLEDGEMQVHDGPYVETKEQIGGYFIVEAADMPAAQKWAAQCPGAIWGHIEIREMVE